MASDTDPRVAALQMAMLRRADPAHKLAMAAGVSESVRVLALAGVLRGDEVASPGEVAAELAGLLHGVRLPINALAEGDAMTEASLISVTLAVTGVLERLGVRYLIGGSLASALHGVPRASVDADILAELGIEHVRPLADALAGDFYLDEGAMESAIMHHSSFNLIHLASMYKVDVFVARGSPFEESQLSRRMAVTPPGADEETFFAAPEDIVLAKLDWYRQGNYVSTRQWEDVLGVLRVQGDRLDIGYMRRWAAELDLTDLLEKAMAEAGLTGNDL